MWDTVYCSFIQFNLSYSGFQLLHWADKHPTWWCRKSSHTHAHLIIFSIYFPLFRCQFVYLLFMTMYIRHQIISICLSEKSVKIMFALSLISIKGSLDSNICSNNETCSSCHTFLSLVYQSKSKPDPGQTQTTTHVVLDHTLIDNTLMTLRTRLILLMIWHAAKLNEII